MSPDASDRLCYYFHLKEVQMDGTVDLTIPVEPAAAAALADVRNREAVQSPGKPRAATALGSEPPRSGDR
jgi:hypothetical protein